ncbi:MAG: hypothetical protein H0U12_00095 [Thermoleophilaceae bacterium]|jgi:hypothetical protein|nr:hypothetical protein [Thermoleophilaceae bacterium]
MSIRADAEITDWSRVEDGPGDGDALDVIDRWIAEAGDRRRIAVVGRRWIKPMETLGEYWYVRANRPRPTGGACPGLAYRDCSLYLSDVSDDAVYRVSLR